MGDTDMTRKADLLPPLAPPESGEFDAWPPPINAAAVLVLVLVMVLAVIGAVDVLTWIWGWM
jgi:hypothetical protein